MSDTNASADALDATSLVADMTPPRHHNDRSEPLRPEQCATLDIRSTNAAHARCWGQSHERAAHARDGREGVKVTEVASDLPAIMLDHAAEGPPSLAKTRADMGSAVASGSSRPCGRPLT
jgi:hypothetical protein